MRCSVRSARTRHPHQTLLPNVGTRQTNGTIFWSYVAQFKVTDKSAEDGPMRCKEMREFNETYGWQSPEQQADCATILFAPACSSEEFPCLGDGPVTVN
ncbi:MAG TPA: hypothetical protein VJT80_20295 [Steroidobacteraceae bacterium]|nr:hypothetical protein [Steroidobacteraceae bacterium]